MRAALHLEVGLDRAGRSVLVRNHGQPPLVARCADPGDGPVEVWLVGAAAGPLGGDELEVDVVVGPGAHLQVRSVAATLVLPGPHGTPSELRVTASVGAEATLDWAPQPTVVAAGGDHVQLTRLEVAAGGRARMAEAVVLGRCDEPTGALRTRQRVLDDGVVVLDHEVSFGRGALAGPGAQGPLRFQQHEVWVGDVPAPMTPVAGPGGLAAVMTLGARLAVCSAQADTAARLAELVGGWRIAKSPRLGNLGETPPP